MDICPRCEKRECENIDGEPEMYCAECNDKLAESYQARKEFEQYHD